MYFAHMLYASTFVAIGKRSFFKYFSCHVTVTIPTLDVLESLRIRAVLGGACRPGHWNKHGEKLAAVAFAKLLVASAQSLVEQRWGFKS
jgi:hypothetical protein